LKFGANICRQVEQGNPCDKHNNCEGRVSNVEHLSKIEAFSTMVAIGANEGLHHHDLLMHYLKEKRVNRQVIFMRRSKEQIF
jgi:hypothetical protein